MSKIFGQNVNFNLNETLKQRVENSLTFPSLTASDTGYIFYHTSQNTFYGWNGISWLDLGASGGGGVTPTLDEVLLEGNISNESIILENTIAASISILDTVSSGRTKISPRSVSTDYTEPDTGTSTMNPVGFHTSGGGSGINSRYAEEEIRYQDDDTTSILYIKPPNPINTGGTISFPDKSGTVALLDDVPVNTTPTLNEVLLEGNTSNNYIQLNSQSDIGVGFQTIGPNLVGTMSPSSITFQNISNGDRANIRYETGDLKFLLSNASGNSNSLILWNNDNIADPQAHIATFYGRVKGETAILLDEFTTKSYVDSRKPTITFAELSVSPSVGDIAVITDAASITYRATATGGGTETALVLYNGTNWIYH